MSLECMYAGVSVALALAVGALVISRLTVSDLKESLTNVRRKLDKLENPLPALYDYDKVPLGNLSPLVYAAYKEPCLANNLAVSLDLLTDEDNRHKFIVVIVTDRGIFVRSIGQDDRNVLTKDGPNLKLFMKWPEIMVGQDTLVYESFIVYKDTIMKYTDLKNTQLLTGDCLRLDYTLNLET